LAIADLLGVPPEDHEEFRAVFSGKVVGGIEDDSLTRAHNPLEYLNEKFSIHITERRREPREDVLTELAAAKFPDGSTPEVIDVVRLATFLFAAGQETTTKLLSFGMRMIAEHPEIQRCFVRIAAGYRLSSRRHFEPKARSSVTSAWYVHQRRLATSRSRPAAR
jgi:cytochrome P450